MSLSKQFLSNYNFDPVKPLTKRVNLQIFMATHKQTSLPYTLKIIKGPDFRLEAYLNRLKQTTSDNVIKIHEVKFDVGDGTLIVVQQLVTYGTLEKALRKCKRLDNDDCIFVGKMILNGHADLLRGGTIWYGDQSDIEFTDSGLKLSWNNSSIHSDVSKLPQLLKKISTKETVHAFLPSPPNKTMNEMISISKGNYSEITLNPIMKKKQKVLKKKGRGWLAIKETKAKTQYFQQTVYLAVSQYYGFVRVKVVDDGEIQEDLIKVYKSNPSFVRIIDSYIEKEQFYTVAQYSNDGTVQSYVKRLKNANIALKQNQIQFFFFSMIEPLKFIHSSPLLSFNLLHIRSIYIEDGIPKIGEPMPLTLQFKHTLTQRSDVPDFYHRAFKQNPLQHNPRFDTYSLGVLIYKLMYTQYPIFPQGKVHIPTTPVYQKNLIAAIQLFLNVGGNLQDLEDQLQVSDDVKKQVKKNYKILEQANAKGSSSRVSQIMEPITHKASILNNNSAQFSQIQLFGQNKSTIKEETCLKKMKRWYSEFSEFNKKKYISIHHSKFNPYLKCLTTVTILLFYFFTFFILFMNGAVNFFNSTRLFTPYELSQSGLTLKIITTNFHDFITEYDNLSIKNENSLSTTLGCKIDNQLDYYDFVRNQSPHWNIYLCFGVIGMIVILTLKGIQLCKYPLAKAAYLSFNQQNTQISKNLSKFALSSLVYFQLWFAFALFFFYYFFNFIYNGQYWPCFGGLNWTKLTQTLMTDRQSFSLNYLIWSCVVWLFGIVSFAQIINYKKLTYSWLKNPIVAFSVFYLILLIVFRIGAYREYEPSWISPNNIIGSSYMNVIGYFPQILLLLEFAICYGFDHLFYDKMMDKLGEFVREQTNYLEPDAVQDKELFIKDKELFIIQE